MNLVLILSYFSATIISTKKKKKKSRRMRGADGVERRGLRLELEEVNMAI